MTKNKLQNIIWSNKGVLLFTGTKTQFKKKKSGADNHSNNAIPQ